MPILLHQGKFATGQVHALSALSNISHNRQLPDALGSRCQVEIKYQAQRHKHGGRSKAGTQNILLCIHVRMSE